MRSAPKTAAYGLFSALFLALTVTGEAFSAQTAQNTQIPENPAAERPAPELRADTRVSTTGFYGLSWSLESSGLPAGLTLVGYLLEERLNAAAAWTKRYAGPDDATTLTGMPDGDYTYRVRALLLRDGEESPDTVVTAWSPPVTVEVRHHSLARAFGFLLVGAVVFLATLVLILRGSRREQ